MAPHEQRVVTEKDELDEKISKLEVFVAGDFFLTLDRNEQMRMLTQLNYMRGYSHTLGWRISAFTDHQ